MSHLKNAQAFQQMMNEQGSMEAFEKYYAENCTVIEMPTGVKREGKEAQRAAIQEWFSSVKEMHGGGVNAITSNEEAGTTMIESWFDVTFQNGHRTKMEEVGIQEWKDNQIVNERFYYNIPGQ